MHFVPLVGVVLGTSQIILARNTCTRTGGALQQSAKPYKVIQASQQCRMSTASEGPSPTVSALHMAHWILLRYLIPHEKSRQPVDYGHFG
ncbi:hypothetical protein BJ166DRAFT_521557 [Pestalotiopsis sp. NC0098]|nr:hypothetical protein BJ166DRAFT_521557 [Pestalotiopsis sp. NC0098]